jgi:transposase
MQGRAAAFKKLNFERLLQSTIIVARESGLIAKRPQIAGDGTGFEVGQVSFYYRSHRGRRHFHTPRWPKLTACIDIESHLFVSANVGLGPSRDTLQAPAVLRKAHRRVNFRRVLWDGGCDSEGFHQLVREELKAHSVVPIKSGRKTRRWPPTKFRRQMRKRFFKRLYGQRWQIESAFSRHKRRLHSALRARTWGAQQAEVSLRVVVHNLMILRRIIEAFQQSNNETITKTQTNGSEAIPNKVVIHLGTSFDIYTPLLLAVTVRITFYTARAVKLAHLPDGIRRDMFCLRHFPGGMP